MILFWGVDASKRRWHEPSARQKGIMPVYRWTGPGRDGLEVAYGKAESRPHVSTVREMWRERHGHRAAPLLLVVIYPDGHLHRVVLCGPAGDDPRVVGLDYEQAHRIAAAALGEPDRHMAIRFLSEALEGARRGRPYLRSALPARYRDQVDIVDLVSNPRIGLNFPTAYSKSVTGDI